MHKGKNLSQRIRLFWALLFIIPAFSLGQTGGQSNETELNNYNNTINFPKTPKVEFKELGERKMLSAPEMKFVADSDVIITYDFTIGPQGRVQYVRPHYCRPEFNEYRKGGIYFLYNSRFNVIPEAAGHQQVTAVFTFPGVEFPKGME